MPSLLKKFSPAFSVFQEAMYRAYRRMETKDQRLLYLFLELTQRCNLSCIHCGSDCSSKKDKDLLDQTSWETVIDYVAEKFKPLPAITLTGGEPLLLDWVEKLGAYIVAKNMRWGFVTNGLLLSECRLRAVISSKVESITISLDGEDKIHDRIRGRTGVWNETMKAILLLGASCVPVKDVVTCVTPMNLRDLDKIAARLSSTGINSWRLFRIFPKGRAIDKRDLFLDKKAYLELLKWICHVRPKLANVGIDVSLSCDGWLPYTLDRQVRSTPFFCRSGVQIASILHDGTITGCPNNDLEFSQGNFFINDFASVWAHGFEPFRDRSWLKSTTCAGCEVFSSCYGGSMHAWRIGSSSSAQCWMRECMSEVSC